MGLYEKHISSFIFCETIKKPLTYDDLMYVYVLIWTRGWLTVDVIVSSLSESGHLYLVGLMPIMI